MNQLGLLQLSSVNLLNVHVSKAHRSIVSHVHVWSLLVLACHVQCIIGLIFDNLYNYH